MLAIVICVSCIEGIGYDLPAIDLEEDSTHLWMQTYTGNSNSSFELDFFGDAGSALMVNPNSVMPFVTRGIKREKGDDEKPSSPVNSVCFFLFIVCFIWVCEEFRFI